MQKKLSTSTHKRLAEKARSYWKSLPPEARLNEVEILRIEAGKFLYEYPAGFRRVFRVTGKTSG
jgi:hypothetical protein